MNFDPLKFSIQIVDDIDSQLKSIKDKLNRTFNGVPLSLKIDPSSLNELRNEIDNILKKASTINSRPSDALSKQTWNEIDAFRNLSSAIDKAQTSLNQLEKKNSNYNSSVSSTLYKQFTGLNSLINEAIGQSSKVDSGSLDGYIKIVSEKFSRLKAEMETRGNELAKTFHAQFGSIDKSMGTLTSLGSTDARVRSVQETMAGISSTFLSHISAMQQQLQSLKEAISNDNFTAMSTRINACAESMDKLSGAFQRFTVQLSSDSKINEFITGIGELIRSVRVKFQQVGEGIENMDASRSLNNYKRNMTIMTEALNQLQDAQLRVTRAMNEAKQMGAPTDMYERYLSRLRAYMIEVRGFKNDTMSMSEGGAATLFLGKSVKHFNENSRAIEKQVAAMKSAKNEEYQWAQSQIDAATKIASLIPLMERMKALSLTANKLYIDTKDLDNAIAKLQLWMDKLDKLSRGDRSMGITKDMLKSPQYSTDMAELLNSANPIRQQIAAIREADRAKRQLGKSTQELTLEEQRLAKEIDRVTQSSHKQSQVLSDLRSMAMQYMSVYAGQQFLGNIIEIGGQLENQRLSIGAILGDISHANTLFEQIQSLAVKSPFGVVELDQYTKQLSAYGFQYNELYDMTKRLADISAGAGTDVGRLALALGHVRSEGALTGYTLRQFAMNNIPMLKELSNMLSVREGREVSTSDIRKRVSKKMIGFEDVQQVITNLTNEGGMFYNMQEVISGSTKSKWKNLRDAMDIMYGRMAESSFIGGGLKNTASFLTNLTKHWQELIAVMGASISMWGISRAAMAMYNSALGENATAVYKAMRNVRRQEMANLEVAASYRTVTNAERANISSKNQQLITTAKLALNTGKLSVEELSRSVALGIMSKQEAIAAISASNLNAAMKTQAIGVINGTKVLGKFGRVIVGLEGAFVKLGMAMKAVFMNPMTYIMAAVTLITELWARNHAEMETMKETAEGVLTKGKEGLKNTKQMFGDNGISMVDSNGKDITKNFESSSDLKNSHIVFPVYADLDKSSVKSMMEDAEQYIKEYSNLPNMMMNDAFAKQADGSIPTLEQQYNSLMKSVEDTAKAQAYLKNEIADSVRYALEATDDGWWNDGLIKNINDYSTALTEYQDYVTLMTEKHADKINKAMKSIMQDTVFAEDVKQREKERNSPLTDSDKLKMLYENFSKYAEAYMKYGNELKNIGDLSYISIKYKETNKHYQTMMKDLDTFVSKMKAKLKESGWDFENLTKSQQMSIGMMLSEVVAKAGESSDAIKDKVVELAYQKFNIQLDVDIAEAVGKISAMKMRLEEVCNSNRWIIEVGITGDLESDLDKVKSNFKKARDEVKEFGAALMKVGMIQEIGDKVEVDGKGVPVLLKRPQSAIPTPFHSRKENADVKEDVHGFDQTVEAYIKALENLEAAKKYFEEYGLTPPDETNGGGRSGYFGEMEKRWDERIRIMKEAYDWYEKWRKAYGKDTALEEVNKKYKEIFDSWQRDSKLPFIYDVNEIENYKKYVEDIRRDAQALYDIQKGDKSKNNGQEALRVVRQAVSLLTDMDWDVIQKQSDQALSRMTKRIEDLTDRWKIFAEVLESTGNRQLAGTLAGVSAGVMTTRVDDLERMIKEANSSIDLREVVGMSAEDIQQYISETIAPLPVAGESESEYAGRIAMYNAEIKSTVDLIKEWQKATKDLEAQDISTYAKIIGSAQDFQTLIQKNNAEYDKQEQSLARLLKEGKISQNEYDKRVQYIASDRDLKNGKLSATYENLVNRSSTLAKEQFGRAMATQINLLNKALDNNVITLSQYNEEMSKMRKIEQEFKKSNLLGVAWLSQYASGGLEGLRDYYDNKAMSRISELKGKGMNSQDAENDELVKRFRALSKGIDDTINSLDRMALGIGMISGLLDGFTQAFDSMAQMYDALGNKGASNWFSDASDAIKGVSSIFSPVNDIINNAKSGNVGGLISSAVSAPFKMIASPITAFSQLHDKKIEREIADLNDNVSKIENNTSLIKQFRSRTLGYDTGDMRRLYSSMYYTMYQRGGANNKALKDMYEYYSRGGTTGTGYQQEYNNLVAERDNYIRQLQLQESKKKKSQSDIEATKQKIAELNDQIYNYTQDMAKELWGIDVKGYAQQLSDALCSAFENGENAAKAYNDTVTNILRNISSKMMQMALEPMFTNLQNKLFGQMDATGNYTGGAFDLNNPTASIQRMVDVIAEFFGTGGEGRGAINAAKEMWNAYEKALNDMGLTTISSDVSSLSNGISGTSEETSNLLAGYVNALRQDVAINRLMLAQFTGEYWESYISQITGIQGSLNNIDRNVAAIYSLMNEQGALFSMIRSMDNRLRNFSNGMEKMYVN